MKKQRKTLRLNRETLRRLAAKELQYMVGGWRLSGMPTLCDPASGCNLYTTCPK
jgi:hypothetical protein